MSGFRLSMNTNIENTAIAPASTPLTAVPGRDSRAFAFCLLVWAIMLAAALILVAMYGRNVPTWDDWDIVPTATGHRPVTAEWLWSQHNEHRVAVPRLLLDR